MSVKLKKLNEQIVVITGATSGIGLATARLAAERGARLVLAARNEEALKDLVTELEREGHEAVYVVADVGRESDVHNVAQMAQERFGGFDTWINNAGVGIFGALLDGTTEDYRKLFDTNFWGLVYGSLTAARGLKHRGGALINIGSALSDRAIPLQGMYSTSKHAVKGFTEALRVELEADNAPVSVTLIKPASIDTPYPHHAKNYMDEEPTLPPPVYAPEVVAEAILHCAETPERDVIVGGGGKLISAAGRYAPRLTDKAMETQAFFDQQKSGNPVQYPGGALDRPTSDLQERGDYQGRVRGRSLYTSSANHPLATALVVTAGFAAAALLLRSSAGRD